MQIKKSVYMALGAFMLASIQMSVAHAEPVALDRLFQVGSSNFCSQQNNDTQVNVARFFSFTPTSNFSLGGVAVDGVVADIPTLNVNTTSEQFKADLRKNNTQHFSASDIDQAQFKNVYGIQHKVHLRFNMKAAQVANLLSSRFPGIEFKADSFSGKTQLSTQTKKSLNEAKTIAELNDALNTYNTAQYTFEVHDLTGDYAGQSILNYQCDINLVTARDAQSVANQLGQR
jgi:mRNA-degrading endonuclease YafQ of YafQ-DinJ toxin-antitoxin module